jgi:hypothetical protein
MGFEVALLTGQSNDSYLLDGYRHKYVCRDSAGNWWIALNPEDDSLNTSICYLYKVTPAGVATQMATLLGGGAGILDSSNDRYDVNMLIGSDDTLHILYYENSAQKVVYSSYQGSLTTDDAAALSTQGNWNGDPDGGYGSHIRIIYDQNFASMNLTSMALWKSGAYKDYPIIVGYVGSTTKTTDLHWWTGAAWSSYTGGLNQIVNGYSDKRYAIECYEDKIAFFRYGTATQARINYADRGDLTSWSALSINTPAADFIPIITFFSDSEAYALRIVDNGGTNRIMRRLEWDGTNWADVADQEYPADINSAEDWCGSWSNNNYYAIGAFQKGGTSNVYVCSRMPKGPGLPRLVTSFSTVNGLSVQQYGATLVANISCEYYMAQNDYDNDIGILVPVENGANVDFYLKVVDVPRGTALFTA